MLWFVKYAKATLFNSKFYKNILMGQNQHVLTCIERWLTCQVNYSETLPVYIVPVGLASYEENVFYLNSGGSLVRSPHQAP